MKAERERSGRLLYTYNSILTDYLTLKTPIDYVNYFFLLPSLQFNIYIGSFFLIALSGGEWYGWSGFWVGSLGFSGFFTYEVCRKLDPSLPRVGKLRRRFCNWFDRRSNYRATCNLPHVQGSGRIYTCYCHK